MGIIRTIFAAIDTVIYSVVATILQAIVDLSNIEVFQQSVIREFANRIYIILGLVMLFKMIISFIQILIDPDKMDDKESGMANVLKRVVIALLLIVMVPSIFDLSRQLQNYILPIIPKVVLGVEADFNSSSGETTLSSAGREMAFYTFLAFFNYDNVNCDDGSIRGTGSQLSTEGGISVSPSINSVNDAAAHVNDSCNASTDSRAYKYQYRFVLSTIVGLYLIYTLVTIAVNVAIRTFKFAICEFIAPIPIASYIDPKTSKQSFDSWVKTSVDTYVSLFIQLAMVYFMIFVFEKVLANNFISALFGKLGGDWWRTSMVILFLVAGLLTFVKSAPKFITDMLGIKGDGSLAGIFKGEGWKQSATALGGLAGTGLASIGSAVGNYRNSYRNDTDMDKGMRIANALRRGAGGFIGSTRRGLTSTVKGEGWKGAYRQNIDKTRDISNRHSTAKALARISSANYQDSLAAIDEKIKKQKDKLDVAKRTNDTAAIKEYEDKIRRLENQKNVIPKPISPTREKFTNAFSSWQGLDVATGSSYSSAASSLSSARSSYFTGEAMKKLNEEGSKLNAIYHDYDGHKFNFSTLKDLKNQVDNGSYDPSKLGISSAKIDEYFLSAQKNGAIDYINAVAGTLKDASGKKISIENNTISEGFKQVAGMLDGLNIDPTVKAQLMADFNNNKGQFFKDLSDVAKQLETTGTRRSAYEQNQDKK